MKFLDRHPGGPRAERRTIVVRYSIFGIIALLALALFGTFKVRTHWSLKALGGLGLTSITLASILTLLVTDSQTVVSPTMLGSIDSETAQAYSWSFFDIDVVFYAFYAGFALIGLAAALFILGRVGRWVKPYVLRFARFMGTRGARLLKTIKATRVVRYSVPDDVRSAQKVGHAAPEVDLVAVRAAYQD